MRKTECDKPIATTPSNGWIQSPGRTRRLTVSGPRPVRNTILLPSTSSQTSRARIPLLAYSETLVDAGALLCVAPDSQSIGIEAARTMRRILDQDVTPGTIAPVAPTGARVVLNVDVQESIGLRIDPMLMDFVDQTVQQKRER